MRQQRQYLYTLGLMAIAIAALIFLFRPPTTMEAPQSSSPQSFADMIAMVETVGQEPIQPLPTEVQWPAAQVELGRRLFHERKLSSNHQISCATCHILQSGGDDDLPISIGINNKALAFNTPTVLNSGFNFRQFWDGRAVSLEEQVDDPLLAPGEMGNTWENLLSFLQKDRGYRQAFQRAYGGEISSSTVRHAIATFQRSLITPSPFDAYLRGEQQAISTDAQLGYQHFKDYGCIACHQGVNVGGNVFQPLGAVQQYRSSLVLSNSEIKEQSGPNKVSMPNSAQTDLDFTPFKVPGLRNVALTAPYLHDGSVPELQEVIQLMAMVQLGRPIALEHVRQIEAFLKTLTGEQIGGQDA